MATPVGPSDGGAVPARRFRGPAAVNGAVVALVLALVAAIALPASQTPPPAIAEFSPQAQQQITDAPPEQSSDLGEGEGGSATGSGATTTTTSTTTTTTTVATTTPEAKEVIDPAAVRRCVGDPPRQTEDPQSAPCVNRPFVGDNGGATWKGVSANEIRIGIPANGTFAKELFAHFNARYEFYGRKLVAVPLGSPGSVEGMVAEAIKADVVGGVSHQPPSLL
jgi:hypothetical protein